MSELKVTFKLSAHDVKHLRQVMRKAATAAKGQTEEAILSASVAMAAEVRKFKPPQYVMDRVNSLETLIEMVRDKPYGLPTSVRRKVLAALTYFTQPADLIPDTIPGLGFLDDAIMIELSTRELRHELAAYQDFCRFREAAEQRPWTKVAQGALERKLTDRRRKLRARVAEREGREASRSQRGSGLLRLW